MGTDARDMVYCTDATDRACQYAMHMRLMLACVETRSQRRADALRDVREAAEGVCWNRRASRLAFQSRFSSRERVLSRRREAGGRGAKYESARECMELLLDALDLYPRSE